MTIRSHIVLLLLVLASTGTLANDCEQNESSVFEASNCLSCGGCYSLVESHYNRSFEAHVNFTSFYEHFLNFSQLNIPQLVDQYLTMLRNIHSLAVETAQNERNLTFQLSMIADATSEANILLDMLKRNLSSAMNGSRTARVTHNSSITILRELDMLVTAINDIVSNNITVISNRTASINDQILAKLELVAGIADNTSSTSHWQINLATTANLTAREAHNISSMALDTLCQAIELHNATSDLVHQLSSQDRVNVTMLRQQINAVLMVTQQTISQHDVFSTSQQLITEAANISIPSYDVELLGSMVHDIFQNVSELFADVANSLDQLAELEEQAAGLNDTGEELLQTGKELIEEANMLFIALNESFFRTMENIDTAESYFDDLTALHDNLTSISEIFNDSITDVVTRLEEEDVENISRLAYNLSVDGQEGLARIQTLLSATEELLDNSTNQLADDNVTLITEREGTDDDLTEIRGATDLEQRVIGLTVDEWNNIVEVNETATNQSSQLINLNFTALTIEERLDVIKRELERVRNELENLMRMLQSLDLTETDIREAETKVEGASTTVQQNSELLEVVMGKMEDLHTLSDELELKYTQLKQHRDLLRQIQRNIGDNSCVN